MKAIRMHGFGDPDVLSLDDVDVPRPGAGEVLLKVEAVAVTYGDIMKRSGAFGQEVQLPAGLGLEIAGTVAELGPEIAGLSVGSRVLAWVESGYAEYAVAPAAAVVPLPDGVDLRSAAVLPVKGVTAYQTLRRAGRLRPGESVLVHAAAGGVGSLAVQLARLLGAETVIGTASSPLKLDFVRALGAIAIDYTVGDWPEQVLKATGGRGVDLVLDSVGGGIARRSFHCLAPFGRLVTFGAAGGTPVAVDAVSLMLQNQSVTGYSLNVPSRPANTDIRDLLDHLGAGRLEATIDLTLPLVSAPDAHRTISQRRTLGSVLLLP
ncbi:zinc-binding dehydrogenase [Kribbella sp. NPDC051137]|uniref:quinone oxidoreductase family protein n=1 Tax=Kribbella sp. NPDC051137 TaxID=3155045 RepID=UPI003440812B